ncbi:hypothetical protein HP467_00425 [Curtobacterium albidum]|uniref:Uncharacterized protein n=1 Tax=Curtobacterium citreum TaxID=2036 RepID=A0A850DSU4_9MICO|nr:hypothetical protein [Curtobacterium albidum]NUU26583.1 hypothetical protein [Curtobacterium albidum]
MAQIREVERKTGRAYEVRWRDGGKFRPRSFTDKREAERFALTVENEQHAGNNTAPLVKTTKTIRQVAEESMDADRPNRKRKTMDAYEIASVVRQVTPGREHQAPMQAG